MSDTPIIEERENGPLVVKSVQSMTLADGQVVEVKEVMALCRCGASKSKPFCDGSHKDIGFESHSGSPSGANKLLSYKGDAFTVHYNPMICSHAAECIRLASNMFDPAAKPWVTPNAGDRDQIDAVMAACPSGALSLSTNTQDRAHQFGTLAQIVVEKDGPYRVQEIAPPMAQNADGTTPHKYVLCRCGLSGNKPFCDGSHHGAGWRDA
ncbi:MAG: CDGSH-type Zn-finger protein [Paracoccaceae bacterium]|jgi:CDGSH-type Zn-finger protein